MREVKIKIAYSEFWTTFLNRIYANSQIKRLHITCIDRSELIANEFIDYKMKTLFHYQKKMYKTNDRKLRVRWGPLLNMF